MYITQLIPDIRTDHIFESRLRKMSGRLQRAVHALSLIKGAVAAKEEEKGAEVSRLAVSNIKDGTRRRSTYRSRTSQLLYEIN